MWARRVPPGVNKLSNRTEELSSLFPPVYPLHIIIVKGVKLWNELDEDMHTIISVYCFKRMLTKCT